jgi:hypothetical protein
VEATRLLPLGAGDRTAARAVILLVVAGSACIALVLVVDVDLSELDKPAKTVIIGSG